MIYALKNIENFIRDNLKSLSDETLKDCLDVILTSYLLTSLEEKKFTNYTKEVILHLQDRIIKFRARDLNDFINMVSMYARENSKGACRLSMVFIPDSLEDKSRFSCINNRITVVKTNDLSNNTIIGLCSTQFLVNPEKLVFQAKIGD